MTEIFVSYSRENLMFTRRLVSLLDRAYDDVWFDKDLRGGQMWKQEIMRRIGTCDIFLYLVSTDSLNSPYCREEYGEAVRLKKPILPVLIDPAASIPDDLSRIQYVDMSASVTSDGQVNILPEDINELHAAIRQITAGQWARPGPARAQTKPAKPVSRRWLAALPLVLLIPAALLGLMINGSLPLKSGLLAFTSNRDGNSEIYTLEGGFSGYLGGLAGSNPRNLTRDRSRDEAATWSPDGTRLAFTSYADGSPQIYLMPADGSAPPQRLTGGLIPAWSPDGTRIAFALVAGNSRDLFVVDVATGITTNLTNSPDADESYPTWSPDGTRIAYQLRQRQPAEDSALPDEWSKWDVYIMNADGTSPTGFVSLPDADDAQPSWSPDGAWIAFQSNRERVIQSIDGEVIDRNPDIYVMATDGSGTIRNATNHTAIDAQPSWSSDGTQLAFASDRDGNYDIFVIDTACLTGTGNCGEARQLTNSGDIDVYPAWKPGV